MVYLADSLAGKGFDGISAFWTALANPLIDPAINVACSDSTGNGPDEWVRVGIADTIHRLRPDLQIEYALYGGNFRFPWPTTLYAGAQGERAINFNGTRGRYIPYSDVGALTGDLDIQAKVNCPDYTIGGVNQLIVSLWGAAGNRGFYFGITADGRLQFHWSTDGTIDNFYNSSALSALVDGQDAFVRVTAETGTGEVKFYDSTDGNNWVLRNTFSTTPYTGCFAASGVPYELGSRGSTGSEAGATSVFRGRIYKCSIRDSVNGTIKTPQGIGSWISNAAGSGADTPLTGSQTVYIYNGSVAGAGLSYWSDKINSVVTNFPFQYTLISTSHNDGPRLGKTLYDIWEVQINAIFARNPTTHIGIVLQNPETTGTPFQRNPEPHNRRVAQLAMYARKKGFDVINVYKAFIDSGRSDLIADDGVHPTTGEDGGNAFWSAYIARRLETGLRLAS